MTEKQDRLSAIVMASAHAYHATHGLLKLFGDFVADALFTSEEHTPPDQVPSGWLPYTAPELAAANPDPANTNGEL